MHCRKHWAGPPPPLTQFTKQPIFWMQAGLARQLESWVQQLFAKQSLQGVPSEGHIGWAPQIPLSH
jgi:hypothetical protein